MTPHDTENRAKLAIFGPETRVLQLDKKELRVITRDGGGKTIVGYAAKYNKPSQLLSEGKRQFIEKISPGAFDACLKRCDVRGLKNHDPNYLLGRTSSGTMRLISDATGLGFEIDAPETQAGKDALIEIDRGDLDGCSFTFTVDAGGDVWDETTNPPTRTLRSVRDLFDVGPVTFPAYLDTEVSARAFCSLDSMLDQREAEARKAAESRESQALRILKLRLGIH